MNTMLITERQAFMALSGLLAKEIETTLCSDEYLFMIELAKFSDPYELGYNDSAFIADCEEKARVAQQFEEEEEREEIVESEEETEVEDEEIDPDDNRSEWSNEGELEEQELTNTVIQQGMYIISESYRETILQVEFTKLKMAQIQSNGYNKSIYLSDQELRTIVTILNDPKMEMYSLFRQVFRSKLFASLIEVLILLY